MPGPRRLKGHGGYAEDIGSKLGGWLGGKAGNFLSSLFGFGEYKVNRNSLMTKGGPTAPNDPPIVSNTTGGTRIQHREYIQDITGSTSFNILTFPVQPGIATTFPWLSSVAGAFEEYILHGILFEFKSTSADALNSTNTALGTVIMATEYNPLHGAFTSKRDMENYVYSTSSPPSVSALHPIECARDVTVLSELFVRNVPMTGADLRFSDLGLFQIATVGMQAAAVIGELWVTYDIELLKPKLPDAYTSVGPAHYAYSVATGTPTPQNGVPIVTNLFGTPASPKLQLLGTGVSPVTLGGPSGTSLIRFNSTGRYIVNVNLYSATTWTSATPVVTYAGNINPLNIYHVAGGVANFFTTPPPAVTTVALQFSIAVDVVSLDQNSNPYFTLNFVNFPASGIEMDVWIHPLPTGFSTPRLSPIEKLQNELTLMKQSIQRVIEEHESELDYKEPDPTLEDLPSDSPVLVNTKVRSTSPDISESTIDLARMIRSAWRQPLQNATATTI